MANRSSTNGVAALVVVGLGMTLIAALAGIVLYVITTRRRHAGLAHMVESELAAGGGAEPAEA
ncbi:MAG: hypothetical protein ABMB14_30455 [Myxococcota bacterium]